MPLPTPEQLSELRGLMVQRGWLARGGWGSFSEVYRRLDAVQGSFRGPALQRTVGMGVPPAMNFALTKLGAGASGLATGVPCVAFATLGSAVAPWIAVADVARQAGGIFSLHDLKDHALGKGKGPAQYACVCGQCFKNLEYVVNKKERNIARVAVGVATLGVTPLVTTAWSIVKSFQSGRPKEKVSRGLVDAARGDAARGGCTVAIAAIFLLAGSWAFLRGGHAGTMRRAISIMIADDGWAVLKDCW